MVGVSEMAEWSDKTCRRSTSVRKTGGRGGIRTHGCLHIAGFQDRCIRPLCHPSGKGRLYRKFQHRARVCVDCIGGVCQICVSRLMPAIDEVDPVDGRHMNAQQNWRRFPASEHRRVCNRPENTGILSRIWCHIPGRMGIVLFDGTFELRVVKRLVGTVFDFHQFVV